MGWGADPTSSSFCPFFCYACHATQSADAHALAPCICWCWIAASEGGTSVLPRPISIARVMWDSSCWAALVASGRWRPR